MYEPHIWNILIICILWCAITVQWHHNGRNGVSNRASNHQPYDCLLNRLCRCRWEKTSKLGVTGLCVGNSPVTGEFPTQMASNAENFSIWWRHHGRILDRMYVQSETFDCKFVNWIYFLVKTPPVLTVVHAGSLFLPPNTSHDFLFISVKLFELLVTIMARSLACVLGWVGGVAPASSAGTPCLV